jgi:hypothetical protein
MTKPSMKQAVLAMCHQCQGQYTDGKVDCLGRNCPLYYWFPYRQNEPDLWWETINPKRVGTVDKGSKRKMSEEQKAAFVQRVAGKRGRKREEDQSVKSVPKRTPV